MSLEFLISDVEKEIVSTMVDRFEVLKKQQGAKLVLIDAATLDSMLALKERAIVEKVKGIDPFKFGFRGKLLGFEPVPDDLVALKGQTYPLNGEPYVIPTQYVPKRVYEAYAQMNAKMKQDVGEGVYIESGYRSPTYQILTLLYYLNYYKFDMARTLELVAMPGYSEHGFPPRQAVDFITESGVPQENNPEEFEITDQFKWLSAKAGGFGFVLSYPRNNPDGIAFEPWHWHFADVPAI